MPIPFSPTDIPAGVDTLGKVVGWSCGAYYQLLFNERYQESDGAPLIPLVTLQDGLAANKTERAIFRVSLHLNPDWRVSSNPFFLEVIDPVDSTIPAAFLP